MNKVSSYYILSNFIYYMCDLCMCIIYIYMSAKDNFGYHMRMAGYFPKIRCIYWQKNTPHIYAPIKYFLGFDLTDKKNRR